jgi:hypothetical protein
LHRSKKNGSDFRCRFLFQPGLNRTLPRQVFRSSDPGAFDPLTQPTKVDFRFHEPEALADFRKSNELG